MIKKLHDAPMTGTSCSFSFSAENYEREAVRVVDVVAFAVGGIMADSVLVRARSVHEECLDSFAFSCGEADLCAIRTLQDEYAFGTESCEADIALRGGGPVQGAVIGCFRVLVICICGSTVVGASAGGEGYDAGSNGFPHKSFLLSIRYSEVDHEQDRARNAEPAGMLQRLMGGISDGIGRPLRVHKDAHEHDVAVEHEFSEGDIGEESESVPYEDGPADDGEGS